MSRNAKIPYRCVSVEEDDTPHGDFEIDAWHLTDLLPESNGETQSSDDGSSGTDNNSECPGRWHLGSDTSNGAGAERLRLWLEQALFVHSCIGRLEP
jgi:hypothetical protein